jgi:hypothetical protein
MQFPALMQMAQQYQDELSHNSPVGLAERSARDQAQPKLMPPEDPMPPEQSERDQARMQWLKREVHDLNQPERRGNGGFGGFLQRLAEGLPGAMAAANGDHMTAMRYNMMLRDRRENRDEERQRALQQRGLRANMVKMGMSPMEAEMAAIDPRSFSAEFNSRFRTREASEGQGIVTPGFDGSQSVYTQPKHMTQGDGIVRVGGNSVPERVYQGPTPAVENATALGLQPGTPEFDTFVRDYTLNGQGPTGTATTRRGQDFSRQNTIDNIQDRQSRHTTPRPASPGNSDTALYGDIMRRWSQGGDVNAREREFVRSYETRRAPRGRQGSGRPGSGVNAPSAVGPNGQRIYFRGGRWVDAQGRPVS